MVLKKVSRKVSVAFSLLKDDGLLAVGIRSLEYIQKKRRKHHHSKTKHQVNTDAIYEEVVLADISKPANREWQTPLLSSDQQSLTINWLMPPPGKGSGGHMTIFRFIKYLEDAGHSCRIYFHKPGRGSTVGLVKKDMGDSFPAVKASMEWLQPGQEMAEADALFATSWQTAYTVYASAIKAKKFYFVQDFEPYFYPIGSAYILAENTYRLGLRGITAGGWLAKKLHDDYGMVTSSFSFGSDARTYNYSNDQPRREIVFYARPTTPRRAFELGIVVLDLFHRKHPEYIINFIGWDVAEYLIPFPYRNLGILTPQELNEVYNRSAAALVMSLTNMSLLPLELLGSGCIPVVNDGENNHLVSDNEYIAYSISDPSSMANRLSEIVTQHNLPDYSKKASESVKGANWDDAGKHFVEVVENSISLAGDL